MCPNCGRISVYSVVGGKYQLDWELKNFGHTVTDIYVDDFDNDGKNEIIVTNCGDSSVHAFEYANDTYEEEWNFVFGGYTGCGFVPSVCVGDADANEENEIIMGLGGHYEVPEVGSGVYVFGYGMVLYDEPWSIGVSTIILSDVDNDNKKEIVASSTDGNAYIIEYKLPAPSVFDTGKGTYPSIMGTHKGGIKPSDNINVSTLYTYACAGTGGHTESIKLYENDELIASGT